MRRLIALGAWITLGALTALASAGPQESQQPPRTVPEVTDYRATSTLADVQRFLRALEPLPHGERLRVEPFGVTTQGRELPLVVVGEPCPLDDAAILASGKLRLCINANIHGGEVEGKEAVQELLREFALGGHDDLLERAVLLFIPVYNADGNDAIAPQNRVSQNGPERGVGQRPNGQGLDLNRDFIKAEAPETRAMLRLFRRLDPHVWMDLHTTNGSAHGYHLTYAPSLSTNVPLQLDGVVRTGLLGPVRQILRERDGFEIFDYGNFGRGEPRAWSTYDHRPRFGTNYVSLRGTAAVLSEAYSYLGFEERIRVTRAFTLEVLRRSVREEEALRAFTTGRSASRPSASTRGWWTANPPRSCSARSFRSSSRGSARVACG